MPGIRRVRAGTGFRYIGSNGRPIHDKATLTRIRALAVPPAWTDVWIAPDPDAHLQATGRDARGRKQYRYHRRWNSVRHETKYSRMVPFAKALPMLRAQITRDLDHAALSRSKVLAAVAMLLDRTWMRVGNREYTRSNGSFGLTTLRDRHVRVRGAALRFEFVGKSGIRHRVALEDRRLARVIKRCQELPGQELFQYLDENGDRRRVTSADVNDYLREVCGADFTAKDFRTWAGTVLALCALRDLGPDDAVTPKAGVVRAVEAVARQLGNTPAVCRACYIHPAVLEAHMDGSLHRRCAARRRTRGLSPDEAAVLHVLQSRRSFAGQLAASVRLARKASGGRGRRRTRRVSGRPLHV